MASGGSYASQNDLRLHFGIGSATTIDRVEIRWPDDAVETHTSVGADRFYTIKRGSKPSIVQQRVSPHL